MAEFNKELMKSGKTSSSFPAFLIQFGHCEDLTFPKLPAFGFGFFLLIRI